MKNIYELTPSLLAAFITNMSVFFNPANLETCSATSFSMKKCLVTVLTLHSPILLLLQTYCDYSVSVLFYRKQWV